MNNNIKIYVDFEIPDDPISFIEKFYEDYLGSLIHNIKSGKITYFTPDCNKFKIQCKSDKYRSFDDLYDLICTYYPEVTPANMLFYICSANLKSIRDLNTSYINHPDLLLPTFATCSSMRRTRLIYYKPGYFNISEFDLRYDSKYTWKELFTMLNIKINVIEITKYIYDCQAKRKEELLTKKELING